MAEKPKIWVRIVEAHATRTWVAIIFAFSAGISVIILVVGGVWNTIANPGNPDLTNNFTTAIASTLGVLVGSLASYIGNPPQSSTRRVGLPDDQITLDVEDDT
jgi:membrane protein DedA with SNARE-associated domain